MQVPQRRRRHRTLFYKEIRAICRFSYRHAYLVFAASLVLCVPAFFEARKIGLDTDLTRLLPSSSDAVRWTEELKPVVGDGGYFSFIFEGSDHDALVRTVEETARRVRQLDGIDAIDYRFPVDFLNKHRYLLIPTAQLRDLVDTVAEWEEQANPFLDDLGLGDEESELTKDDDLERLISRYGNFPDYNEHPDGGMLGMLVHPRDGISNMGAVRDMYREMDAICAEIAAANGVAYGIGGSLRNRVDEFDVLIEDLGRSGTIAVLAILLTLMISFRSIRVLPVLLYPLAAGLLWAFAFVPYLVGDLNTITSFLLMVLFGMGVDYSIHLVKRFRLEIAHRDELDALIETFTSTGRSVATSGVTTALGLSILAISDFRGFSDFGRIGGSSMIIVTLAMLFLMPAILIVGKRWGLVTARVPNLPSKHLALPPRWAAATVTALVLMSAGAGMTWMSFDYDFTKVSTSLPETEVIQQKERDIYPFFFGPAAVWVAPDLETLDSALDLLYTARGEENTPIGAISSMRDFVPSESERRERLQLLSEIKEILGGRWVRRVEDPDRLRAIEDLQAWVAPDEPITVEDLPASIRRGLEARDGSGELMLAANVNGPVRDGQLSMRFTERIYDLDMPAALRGPTGEKPVLAEILWLVTRQAPLIVGLTLIGVFLLVALDRRSLLQTVWVLLPLVSGLILTFGVCVVFGWKLNFLNMVTLPALLGIAVDHGIHYYRRWRELERDTATTQRELFEPITVSTLTTIMGYAGMAFARHPGLRSIGHLAIVGLVCTWLTALILLPGLLGWRARQRTGAPSKTATVG